MQVYRIDISSWTASFRFPNMISGYQPSLPVPPISTICGLVSAAVGRYLTPVDFAFAYVFRYELQSVDLETIYQFGDAGKRSLSAKSNIIRREFLAETQLSLYVDNDEIATSFRQPYFPILLGRSGDLASVDQIQKVELEPIDHLILAGTVVPFIGNRLAAPIQALPTHFTGTMPRRNIGTQPFYLLDWQRKGIYKLEKRGWHEPGSEIDLYWYTPDMFLQTESN